jgi:hypothetical protein
MEVQHDEFILFFVLAKKGLPLRTFMLVMFLNKSLCCTHFELNRSNTHFKSTSELNGGAIFSRAMKPFED